MSDTKLISSVVHREAIAIAPNLALGMKLQTIGVNYRLSNLRFGPISITNFNEFVGANTALPCRLRSI